MANRYNARLNVCDDVDECEEGRDECDHQAEVCYNTIGDYICQEIPEEELMRGGVGRPGSSSSSQPDCPRGFRFFLISCIDVDECAEGSHDCDPAEEACVNEEGGFRCRAHDAIPGQDSCPAGYAFNREMVRRSR